MTMTMPTGGSPTLEHLFRNCVTEEQVQAAAVENLRGPYKVGEVTAFVFRPKSEGQHPMLLETLDDTGLAGCSEGGRMEVGLSQLDQDDMRERAQRWYKTQLQRGNARIDQVVAVVYDDSRSGAKELERGNLEALKETLDKMSKPGWGERAVAAVKRALSPTEP